MKDARHFMLSCFCNCEGIIMTDYLESGKTVTGDYYLWLLKKLQSKLVRKRHGKLCGGVLLLHDNAQAALRAQQEVQTAEQCGFEVLPHPAYSPDLAPSGFFLFPNLQKSIKGRRFHANKDAIEAVEDWLGGHISLKDV